MHFRGDGEDVALRVNFGPTRGRRVWCTAPPVVPKQTSWNPLWHGNLAQGSCKCRALNPALACARARDKVMSDGPGGGGSAGVLTRGRPDSEPIIQNIGLYIYIYIYIYTYIHICTAKARGCPIRGDTYTHQQFCHLHTNTRKLETKTSEYRRIHHVFAAESGGENKRKHAKTFVSPSKARPPPGGTPQGRWSASGQASRCAQLGRTCAPRPARCA